MSLRTFLRSLSARDCARWYTHHMNVSDAQLKSFLADGGLVSAKDFDRAALEAQQTGQSVGDILTAQNAIGEDELRRTYAYLLGIPFVSLLGASIEHETLSLIPEPIARRHNLVAYTHEGGEIEVALLDIDDLAAIEFLKTTAAIKILPRLTDMASIRSVLRQYQRSLKQVFGDAIARAIGLLTPDSLEGKTGHDLTEVAKSLAVAHLLDTLIRHASAQRVSDIHIEPSEDRLFIRYRIDGTMHDAMELPKHVGVAIAARLKLLSNLSLDEREIPQEGRFRAESDGDRLSFRVSIMPTYWGEKIVVRVIRDSSSGSSLESIGFHGTGLERLQEALRAKRGMILIGGPLDAGTSTTLYTLLGIVNTPEVTIATIEDPIEHQIPHINQTQVRPERGFTFAAGLRALVRQDPDIIMVGDLRDKETASLALNAALTGRLVLSGMRAHSAADALSRLLEMGVDPLLLTSTVRAVVGQRLVRTLAPDKEPHELSRDEGERLREVVDAGAVLKALKEEHLVAKDATWKNIPFYRPKENGKTSSGYAGRIGIHEVLTVTETLKALLLKRETSEGIETQARKEGMLTLMEDGIGKAAQGVTSIEEVVSALES